MLLRTLVVCAPLWWLVAACSSGVLGGQNAELAGDWPQWRGPNRTNHSPDTGLLREWTENKPELLWMARGLGQGYSSVSLSGGRIYTTGNVESARAQVILCLDAGDGSLLWSSPLTDGIPRHSWQGARCTPTIDGEHVYATSSDGQIACLRSEHGELVWKKSFRLDFKGKLMSGWGYSESPLVDGELVVCTPGGPDAILVALNKRTGEEIWRSALPDVGTAGRDGAGYSSIVISNAGGVKQYVTLVGRGVIGVRAQDGKFLWAYNRIANTTANIPTPIVTGDYVFCASGYGTGAALLHLKRQGDGFQVEEKYFHPGKVMQNHHGGMVLVGQHVYFGSGHNNGLPMCVELASGEVAWGGRERGPGNGSAAITYADGHLVFRYQSGEVALIEATPVAFRLKGFFKPQHVEGPSWAHPVVIGGKLYLREQDVLMCYDVKAR